MLEAANSLGTWNWFILGAALLAIEIFAPGVFMMWLGLAALAVGAISFFVDWSWQAQFAAFAVFSVAATPLWRRLSRKVEPPADHPYLNRRADALVGRIVIIDKPIVNSVGTVRIDDTVWRVSGPNCPAGSRVRVTHVADSEIEVEPVRG